MDQLHTYIEAARKKGLNDQDIKSNLIANGWDKNVVEGAFNQDLSVPKPPVTQPVSTEKALETSGWDTFEHILLFISLYVMSTAITFILHYFVDYWLPGIRTSNYISYNTFQQTLVRSYLAALIVSLPIFSFLFLNIEKRTLNHPQIRNLKSRKTLIYITLIGTFLIMICNVILTVFSLLNGNITLNFLVHLFVTLSITGTIFGYYLAQVKDDRKINV